MHTLKGGWVGQTFALAKCNESDPGGRKSRIRRSKEERKAMVESFIEKYQKQNNGNFPSLNLTQEKVGGSFYTVREIVREIIQENRVLGPAKFAAEEDTSSHVLEQYPLGSIAIEPQIPLPSPSVALDPDYKTSLVHDSYKEMEVVSKRHYNGTEFVNDAQINGSQTDFGNEESKVAAALSGLRATENVGNGVIVNSSVSAATKSAIVNLTSVEVETFPLKSVSKKDDDYLHGKSVEPRDACGTIKEKHSNEKTPRVAISDSELYVFKSEENSSLLVEEADLYLDSASVRETSTAEITKEVVSLVDSPTRSPHSHCPNTSEGTVHDVDNRDTANNKVLIDVPVCKDPGEIKEIAEIQAQIDAPNGIHLSVCENSISDNSLEQKGTQTESDHQSNDSAIEDHNSTLDRINLESWEVSSKNTDTNPRMKVFGILKAFISSFMKFWTE